MAVSINRLTVQNIRGAPANSRLGDGGGLYLQVGPTGTKSWLFVYRWFGKRPEIGLGSYPAVGLADARRRAEEARGYLSEKPRRDPRSVWATNVSADIPTFGDFVNEWIEPILGDFKNAKHKQQWRNTLMTYGAPIWQTPIDRIDVAGVLRVLQPIWAEKRETAQRLRGRIERVLDAAKARGFRAGENPARWRGHLSAVLPAQRRPRKHHPAMPFQDVPTFMHALDRLGTSTSNCLQFLVLTAARSGEARGATWDEIDWKERIWTIPAQRMKAGKVHRVPLSKAALDLLKPLHEARFTIYVFPGASGRKPLSETAFGNLMGRMGVAEYTAHGFRSAFRDWCGEETSFPREVAETALAHTIGDATERAYRRGDALEKRRQAMDAWAQFCMAWSPTGNVVRLHA